jgi:DNA-binding transcriptional MerR regulator
MMKSEKKKTGPTPLPPGKLYFRIGEVSEITQIPTYVLRFWETEFRKIKPQRTPSGQRVYRKEDVELVLKIKRLLHDKKYTIQGAKQFLLNEGGQDVKAAPSRDEIIEEMRSALMDIQKLLG